MFTRHRPLGARGIRLALVAAVAGASLLAGSSPATAAPRVGTVAVGAQSGTVTTGTAGSVTVPVTVTKSTSFSLTANLTVTGLPAGATVSWDTNPLVWGSFLPVGTTRSATLTINTTAATPAGTSTFTVRAQRDTDANDFSVGTGTLTVQATVGNPQTITFAQLPNRTAGDPDFTVSATASSGLTVSFNATGDCTMADATTVHLTGAGSCSITASQSGDATYSPATDVVRIFTIGASAPDFELYAVTGTTTLPGGATVPVWGYNTTSASVSRPGGPTIVVDEDVPFTIRLHNTLGEKTALLVNGAAVPPDRDGVAAGGTRIYTLTVNGPGTYLYEAGLLPNAQHQIGMGLYGALVVRPHTSPTSQAYNDASTAFDTSATVVLSEIDPALNTASNPAAFDMRNFKARYSLINGKAYPSADPIAVSAGDRVLLRYVNAGVQYHSMAVLGVRQNVIALGGNKLNFARSYVAETFGPGQTADAIVNVPASAAGGKFALYDGSLLLHNSNAAGMGGMLTFLQVGGTPPAGDATGPVTRNVAYAAGTLSATVDDTTTGNSTVAAAEYFLDTVGAVGTGTALTGAFGTVTVAVTKAVAVPSGSHTLYVRGRDSAGNWGAVSSVVVNGGDTSGPATTSPTAAPRITNGTVSVALHATGDDSGTGGSNVTAGEYFTGAVGSPGSGTPMAVNTPSPIVSLDAVVPASVVNGLGTGTKTISIRSKDAANNWGAVVTIDLVIDKTGPAASAISATPNPSNGLIPVNTSSPAVRIKATLTDALTSVKAGEVFFDAAGSVGTGIPLAANDGTWDSLSEPGYADVPLATVVQLSNGAHTLVVRGKDAAGNWGPVSNAPFVVDKLPPTLSAAAASPNPTQGAANVTLSATAADTITSVTAAEWFVGADPGVGSATPMSVTGTGPWTISASINVRSWSEGTYALRLRARDAAGNWGSLSTVNLSVTGPLMFSTVGNTNPPGVAGTADDADIYNWSGSAYSRLIDVSAIGVPTSANVDGFQRVDATHFYLSFSSDTTLPVIGAVQDEDVVYYNAGTWSVYFDGTARGLTAANQDVDAFSIVGGTLYFSTFGNTNPPGVGGTADDADIYSWNGTAFARVWDATANGVPAAANVDGYDRIDATHFYLSFSADTTLTGLGAVQDEDVVFDNAGTWSVYFDGTAHGLTTGNLDVDAFDVP